MIEAPKIPRTLFTGLHAAVFDLCIATMGSNPNALEHIAEEVGLEDQPDEVRELIVAFQAHYADQF